MTTKLGETVLIANSFEIRPGRWYQCERDGCGCIWVEDDIGQGDRVTVPYAWPRGPRMASSCHRYGSFSAENPLARLGCDLKEIEDPR